MLFEHPNESRRDRRKSSKVEDDPSSAASVVCAGAPVIARAGAGFPMGVARLVECLQVITGRGAPVHFFDGLF